MNLDSNYSNTLQGRKVEGGLRTTGYFKQNHTDNPLISVVTVVYNDEQFIEHTILSVINQTYDNVEYIIIDGGSTDGTLDTIRKYEHAIDYWVSEKDEGIYDAMNRGIDVATGEWINFMNAGDTFFNENVVYKIFNGSIGKDIELVFGKSITFYKDFEKIRYKDFGSRNKNFFLYKMPNHQAVFVRRTFYNGNKFDTNLNFFADTEYLRRCFKESSFKEVETIVSRFELGGISNFYQTYKNFKKLVEESYYLSGRYYLSFTKHLSKFVLQKILGKNIYLFLYIRWILK